MYLKFSMRRLLTVFTVILAAITTASRANATSPEDLGIEERLANIRKALERKRAEAYQDYRNISSQINSSEEASDSISWYNWNDWGNWDNWSDYTPTWNNWTNTWWDDWSNWDNW